MNLPTIDVDDLNEETIAFAIKEVAEAYVTSIDLVIERIYGNSNFHFEVCIPHQTMMVILEEDGKP